MATVVSQGWLVWDKQCASISFNSQSAFTGCDPGPGPILGAGDTRWERAGPPRGTHNLEAAAFWPRWMWGSPITDVCNSSPQIKRQMGGQDAWSRVTLPTSMLVILVDRSWGLHIGITICKIDITTHNLLWSTGSHSIFCNNLYGKRIWKRMDMWITESLSCVSETNATL